MKPRLFAFRPLLLLILILAPVSCRIEPEAFDDDFEGSDGRVEYTWNEEGRTLRAVTVGELVFDADDSSLTSISQDGFFSIEERADGETRKWVASPAPDGSVATAYTVDGRPGPMDDDANRWLARTLPRVLRETGLDAGARIRRILEQRGVEGALAEIALIDSDRSRAIHVRELLSGGELSEEQLSQIAKLARRTGSSSELADMIELLADRRPGGLALTGELIEALHEIGSSSMRRRAIEQILQRRDLNEASAVALAQAAGGIRADSAKSEVLLAIAEKSPKTPKTAAAFAEAASTIRSSSEQSRALRALIPKPGVDAVVQARIARIASQIHSATERAAVLALLAETLEAADSSALAAFFEAIAAIDDASEQERVVAALTARGDLSADTLEKTLSFVREQIPEGPVRQRLAERIQRKL